ncbi:MAG: thermonuclease family protein [Pirellulales bacterium]
MSRRFHPPRRRGALVLGVVLALVAARAWQAWRQPAPPENLAEGLHAVRRVVDGDTLLLAGGARVRLLGIDAPESVKPDHAIEPWGKEASDFSRRFVAAGPVRLEFDRERVDRYGRFLAYVWVEDRLLNEELVRAGLARAEPRYRYSSSMKRRFQRAQQEAQAHRRGIWSDATPPPSPSTGHLLESARQRQMSGAVDRP